MHILSVRPHYGHLMAKPPGLEPLDQPIERNSGGAHFPLIIREALRIVIGDRIVILAHVSEHAQHSVAKKCMNFCTAGCSSGFNRDCRVQEGLLDVEGVVRVAIRMYWWEPKNVGSQFRVDCLDQNLDVTVTKSKS